MHVHVPRAPKQLHAKDGKHGDEQEEHQAKAPDANHAVDHRPKHSLERPVLPQTLETRQDAHHAKHAQERHAICATPHRQLQDPRDDDDAVDDVPPVRPVPLRAVREVLDHKLHDEHDGECQLTAIQNLVVCVAHAVRVCRHRNGVHDDDEEHRATKPHILAQLLEFSGVTQERFGQRGFLLGQRVLLLYANLLFRHDEPAC
mmetsp:Transcript_7437/g.29313  ORF Transcript_7437/g.29313 Transcript_7437/m.29313 type:complete len:202 (+) Transcript_7437:3126-3731(+)